MPSKPVRKVALMSIDLEQVGTVTYGEGRRCEKFTLHPNARFSDRAICFQCASFHQTVDEDGECAWTLNFDDRGVCLAGYTNDD